MSTIDTRQFRSALGAFTTGVTIVTTRAPDGGPVGLTANSFNSLSLDPPMVMWALGKSSLSLPAFAAAGHFAVHVLSAEQQPLSRLFATRGADKFAAVAWETGHGGVPLLPGCSARFECATAYQYEGGDHVIFVGRVLAFEDFNRPALAFHGGEYGSILRQGPAPSAAEGGSSFSSDFLGYLLAVAQTALDVRVRRGLGGHRLADEHCQVLLLLQERDGRTLADLESRVAPTGRRVTYQTLAELSVGGLITVLGPDDPSTRVTLTDEGHRTTLQLSAALKAAEADAEQSLGAVDVQTLKTLLRVLVRR